MHATVTQHGMDRNERQEESEEHNQLKNGGRKETEEDQEECE